jgi:hypothetical protein
VRDQVTITEELVPLDQALDELIQRFGGDEHKDELLRARDEFTARTGRLFEDDEIFESRTTAFLEWYVVERPMTGVGVPPAAVARRHEANPAYDAWLASHRSVFEIEEQGGGKITLTDLFGGGLFEVEERRPLAGVAPGDVFEARLLSWVGKLRFGRTFLYHPTGAREAIIGQGRHVRERGGSRADAVDHVASLKVRSLRYRNVAPERVYEMGTAEQRQKEKK